MKTLRHAIEWLLLLVIVSGVFEAFSKSGLIPNYILPAPSAVVISWWEERQAYAEALFSTLYSGFLGFALSAVVGILLALLFSLSERLRRWILPACVFFQTVPVIAIAPLMVIWFGFGRPTVVASSLVVAFFPILANTLLGLESARPGAEDLFRLLGASRWQRLSLLQIPSAVRQIMGGLQIAAGLSIVGALVGEFVGGGGLGGLIDSARTQQKIEIVFGAVILSSLLGLIFIASLRGLRWIFRRYLQID